MNFVNICMIDILACVVCFTWMFGVPLHENLGEEYPSRKISLLGMLTLSREKLFQVLKVHLGMGRRNGHM